MDTDTYRSCTYTVIVCGGFPDADYSIWFRYESQLRILGKGSAIRTGYFQLVVVWCRDGADIDKYNSYSLSFQKKNNQTFKKIAAKWHYHTTF